MSLETTVDSPPATTGARNWIRVRPTLITSPSRSILRPRTLSSLTNEPFVESPSSTRVQSEPTNSIWE